LKYGEDALTWTIQHDSSPLIINTLIKRFMEVNQKISRELSDHLQTWILNYANKIGVVPRDASFFLEVECLFAKYIENYEISDSSFTYFLYISREISKKPFIVINNKHVELLFFNFFNWLYLKRNQDIIASFNKIKDLASYLSLQKNYDINIKDFIPIPSSIGYLYHLKVLNLSANGIKTIPNYIFNLSNLREIDLSENKIEEIPKSISNLKKLKILNLKNNKIHKISSELNDYVNSLNKFDY
jgi:Leucine-rich repeat (LRR) protein